MSDTSEDEIVVTGKRLPNPDLWFWLDFFSWDSGFGSTRLDEGGGGGGSDLPPGEEEQDDGLIDIEIPATDTMPKIELKDLTPEQAEAVLDFLKRAENDPRMAAALQEMRDQNVTLKIVFADDLSPNADPTARATVEFTPLLGEDFRSETFQPGSTVTITVERDEINSSSWESTLAGILSHEFTHFLKDGQGRFLDDLYHGGQPGNSTQDYDDGVYDDLYGPGDASVPPSTYETLLQDFTDQYQPPSGDGGEDNGGGGIHPRVFEEHHFQYNALTGNSVASDSGIDPAPTFFG